MERAVDRLWWLRDDPLALFGLIVLVILAGSAIFAGQVAPFDPTEQHLSDTLQPPDEIYRFGTDQFGRDILSRVIHGTQISLGLGSLAVILAVTVGTTIGLAAGYIGGRVDETIMRVIDIFFAFPPIVLAIFLMATLGPSLLNVVIVVALVTIPQFTRIARSVAISERNQDYVLAAKAMGASTASVLRRHLLVNAFPPLAVQVTVLLADAILIEASLSFLGIGVRPPTPTWGGILSAGRDYVFTGFWWFTVFPGLAIFLAVFSLNVLGDGLRDFIDPTTRPRGAGN